jgi:DNA-binding MarR family transcriptional regulator
MRETSLLAYAEVLENLNERQIQVLKAIDKIEPCNNLMISKYLNLPINSITPRTNELNKKGLIKESKKGICPITKRTTIFYERIRK